MTPVPFNPEPKKNGLGLASSVADELHQESDKLRQLAAKLKARDETLAEMEVNYPYFRKFVYEKLREEFQLKLEKLPSTDLVTLARHMGAKSLEEFIGEFEQIKEGLRQ